MQGKVTIQDVAKAAQVSPATVSLVFNRRMNVRVATAQAVWQAAKSLNYRLQPVGRARGGTRRYRPPRTNRVALLTTAEARAFSPVYIDFLHGVQAASAAHAKDLLLKHVKEVNSAALEEFAGTVDGVVVMGVGVPRLAVENPGFIPYVCAMGLAPDALLQADYVTYNRRMIGIVAARYLLGRERRHCGIVTGGKDPFWQVITDAFARPFEAAGGAVDIFPITRSEVGWQIPTEDIVAACARLDCFFCHMDELAVALYSGLYRNGIHPGRDVEIVSCNNERPLIQGLEPAPAEIDIHAEMVGRRAVEQLLWRLENLTASYARIELEPELVVAVA